MSLYSPTHNFLFTHVPKTGGTSIHRWLTAETDAAYLTYEHPNDAGCHLHCKGARDIMGEETWSKAFKFAFVRSPYTWVESLRRYALRRPDGAKYSIASGDPVAWARDLARRCIKREWTPNGSLMFQHEWVKGCDTMLRFERFADDVDALACDLGIPNTLRHHNFNGEPELPIEGEYREAIAHYFAQDFEALGYER